jgi:hypothetical protein
MTDASLMKLFPHGGPDGNGVAYDVKIF